VNVIENTAAVVRLGRLATVATAAALTLSCPARAGTLEPLIETCAPLVHPVTMTKLIRVESVGHLYAISDDGPANLPWSQRRHMLRSFNPGSLAEATAIAQHLRETGHLFGLGLSQVSSRNLTRFGVTIDQALDPCTNLRIGSRILVDFYLDAQRSWPDPSKAVLAAISAYNTGNFIDGFSNGYVSKVVGAGIAVPALGNQYDSMLPADHVEAMANPVVRYVRPPQLLSSKIAVLHAYTEQTE
jgi:type IV secretion system protein VirB1